MFTSLWIVWLAFFATIEGAALVNKTPGATLSAHIWEWFSIKGKASGWMWRRSVLFAFLLWLLLHLTGIAGI